MGEGSKQMNDNVSRLENVHNPLQTDAKKVLCVCSAGMLRSDTAAKLIWKKYGYNTRSCGIADYCLIPFDEVLATWADEIVVADTEHVKTVKDMLKELGLDTPIQCLRLPDNYPWMAERLQEMILKSYIP